MKQLRTQTPEPASVIVVFPYSSNVKAAVNSAQPYLSVFSKMSLDGAVNLWRRQPEVSLVIPGETCYEGFTGTTDLMIQRAKQAGIPNEKIIGLYSLSDGTPLNNTWLQAKAVAELLKHGHIGAHVQIVGLEYHLRRVRHACEAYGVTAKYVAAETALGALLEPYGRYRPFINKLLRSEAALRFYGILDKQGWIANFLTTKVVGARQVDVVTDASGAMQLESQTASKRLAAVRSQISLKDNSVGET